MCFFCVFTPRCTPYIHQNGRRGAFYLVVSRCLPAKGITGRSIHTVHRFREGGLGRGGAVYYRIVICHQRAAFQIQPRMTHLEDMLLRAYMYALLQTP